MIVKKVKDIFLKLRVKKEILKNQDICLFLKNECGYDDAFVESYFLLSLLLEMYIGARNEGGLFDQVNFSFSDKSSLLDDINSFTEKGFDLSNPHLSGVILGRMRQGSSEIPFCNAIRNIKNINPNALVVKFVKNTNTKSDNLFFHQKNIYNEHILEDIIRERDINSLNAIIDVDDIDLISYRNRKNKSFLDLCCESGIFMAGVSTLDFIDDGFDAGYKAIEAKILNLDRLQVNCSHDNNVLKL